MKLFFILLIMISITGCSNRAVYENIQINNRNSCAKVPHPQYEECIERVSKSYKEYDRERKEVKK